nr:MAG TPA: putative cytoplasmic protein [Caudoviricetes sp.]
MKKNASRTERRLAARRLRDAADGFIYGGSLRETLARLTKSKDKSRRGVMRRLAYLIEPIPIDGETSDGYHTFNELYHHRAVLFSVVVADFADKAWKAKAHHDGTMFDGMFIVGIDTPDGQATYHYDIEPYWDIFRCKELDRAPEWDGHTPEQAIERIGKLKVEPGCPKCWIRFGTPGHPWGVCSNCGALVDSKHATSSATEYLPTRFCPNCGAKVVSE